MYKINNRLALMRSIAGTFVLMAGLCVAGYAQPNHIEIPLGKNASENGFTLTADRSKTYLRAINVMDPVSGKPLELIREVEIKQKQSGEKVKKMMRFERGGAGPMLIPYNSDDDMVVTVLVVNKLKSVPLTKDADKNGYETTLVGTLFDFKAKNVRDPVTDKVLKEIEKIKYKCLKEDPPTEVMSLFTDGNSETVRIGCRKPFSAEVYILDK